MTRAEREAFLADVHVGVIGVAQDGQGPLTVPIWYSYEPGGTVNVIISPSSLKARAIDVAGRFTLCAQTEASPYQYVSVEGPAVAEPVDADERRAMAHRYLGPELGDLYMAGTQDEAKDNIVVRMTPERWRTTDYNKQFA
ncbi:MAG: hypothetical protein QOK06_2533 [Acidimicrobiaceae bacterium]